MERVGRSCACLCRVDDFAKRLLGECVSGTNRETSSEYIGSTFNISLPTRHRVHPPQGGQRAATSSVVIIGKLLIFMRPKKEVGQDGCSSWFVVVEWTGQ